MLKKFFFLTFLFLKIFSEESLYVKNLTSNQVVEKKGDVFLRASPCCSFNFALSLMGYDANILENEDLPTLPYLTSYQVQIEKWKAPHTPSLWIKNSCVWFSKELFLKLGKKRFENYLNLFNYGNKDTSCEICWLSSSLKISPIEQVEFLEKFLREELPVSFHAIEMTKKIFFVEKLSNGWELFGKTGSGFQNDDQQMGWFVGWAQKEENVFVFAFFLSNVQSKDLPAGHIAKNVIKKLFLTKY
jgi:beta-lactamase class D